MAAHSDQEFRQQVRQWLYAYHAYQLPMLEYWLQPLMRLLGRLLVGVVLVGSISLWFVARSLFGQSETFTWIVWLAATLLFMSGGVAGFVAYAIRAKQRQSQRAQARSNRDIRHLPELDWMARAAFIRLMNVTHCCISRARFREELAEVERDAPALRQWQCFQNLRRLAHFGARRKR